MGFLGWYENEDNTFFAPKYVKYGGLEEYIKDREQERAEVEEVTKQIMEGLGSSTAKGSVIVI